MMGWEEIEENAFLLPHYSFLFFYLHVGEEQLHAAAKFRNTENLLKQRRRSEPRDNKNVIENENRDGSSEKK